MKKLVIVESPGKVKKIQGFLGEGWQVVASLGHIRDLPADQLGIDIEDGFHADWQITKGKKAVVSRLKTALTKAEAVYLCTDPDREGEAIAGHILTLVRLPPDKPVYRCTFTSITQDAVRAAIAKPRRLDTALVAAQHARRKLDRLVGYLLSPIVSKKLGGYYSAGRVQSAALRLVVEREREIEAFVPEKYWTLDVLLRTPANAMVKARLVEIQGKPADLKDENLVQKLTKALQDAQYAVTELRSSENTRHPDSPFTTSTLQQAASTRLGIAPEKTMALAQTLYEAGLITYHRTDAVMVAAESQTACRDYIARIYGVDYVPAEIPQYKTCAANAQEAHEAIRPTHVEQTPASMPSKVGEGAALYELIWQRFVASQMSVARYESQVVTIWAGKGAQILPVKFEIRGQTLQFDGFRKVYSQVAESNEEKSDEVLPTLQPRQLLSLEAVQPQQRQTYPSTRYQEAALIAELEKRGIGRPSTYAAILKNIQERGYVRLDKKKLLPTEIGQTVCDFLITHFPDLFAYNYTARMEAELDRVAGGEVGERQVLDAFWQQFHPPYQTLAATIQDTLKASKPTPAPQPTGEKCPKCGAVLVKRLGSKGEFVGCSTFPKCRYTNGFEHAPIMLKPVMEGG